MTNKKTKTHSDKITYRAVQIQGGKIIGRSVQLFNLNSIHFGSLSIGTCTALGNCKGGDSGKKEKDDEGGKEAVFAESHSEPVLKSKCFLIHIDHAGGPDICQVTKIVMNSCSQLPEL